MAAPPRSEAAIGRIKCNVQEFRAELTRYSSQLFRYFSVSPARVAILTDGVVYRFYSDLDEPNKLDEAPFLEVDLRSLSADNATQLDRFTKGKFDLESVLQTAEELRYSKAIRDHFSKLLAEPSDEFLRIFVDPIHSGKLTRGVLDRFRTVVKKATNQYVSDQVERRLRRALEQSSDAQSPPSEVETGDEEDGIVTTVDEMQGFYIVKAILSEQVDSSRVVARDVRSYFGILLDDNNRKPICRLWFNSSQKYVGVFDAEKKETRIPIGSLDEIFALADRLKESLSHVLK